MMWQQQQQQQPPPLHRHHSSPLDAPNHLQQRSNPSGQTNLSSDSLSSLIRLNQASGLTFSSSNPRLLHHSDDNLQSNMMHRSQSMGLPTNSYASGRYQNESFRFPSISEECANSSFVGARTLSSTVLGGMFAHHIQNHHPAHGMRNNTEWSLSNKPPTNRVPTPGPSELYRLISSPTPNYEAILQRCTSHPQEACSFSLHAGCGHVYALHKLLRRTSQDSPPPFRVVEEVMKACPRALVRKQAVREEEDFMTDSTPSSTQNPQPQEEDDAEDVRYEYPLSIAAEYGHTPQILRLLASSTTKSPQYRAEVFRSLDFAMLSHETVRILLEEYAGCVLERGYSEENEGDDDDCPLEKLLFWWDDPDVTGMEEDIATYPQCEMREDLDDLWEKLRMMLYAAVNQTMEGYDESKQNFQVLHYLLRIAVHRGINHVSFPNDFVHSILMLSKFIQRTRAGMFRERDETGSLPLHVALSGRGLLKCDDGSGSKVEVDLQQEPDDGDAPAPVQDDADIEMDEADEPNNLDALPNQDQQRLLEDGDNENNQPPDPEDDDLDDMDEADIENHGNESSSSEPCGTEIIKLILEQHPGSIRLHDTKTRSLPIHLALKHNPYARESIEHFLRLYPNSASMPDGNGRLPIHIALLHNSPSWKDILELAPNTLEKKDPTTGLLPFQIAALSDIDKAAFTQTSKDSITMEELPQELESFTTSFLLLRMNPHLASGLAETSLSDSMDPQVARLEHENQMLRQRIQELEGLVMQMQLAMNSTNGGAMKKRKSFNAMDFFSRA